MNGLLVAIIYTLLFQLGDGTPSLLGSPNLSNPANAAPVLPTQARPPYAPSKPEIGWKVDPIDGKISMIVQIDPDMIREFGAGPSGQEMPVDIPLDLQGRIQKVIFRVGTSPPERLSLPSLSSNRNNGPQSPFMADLKNTAPIDNRTPVTIDPGYPSDVLNTRGNSPSLSNLGGTLATVPLGNSNTSQPAGYLAQSNDPQAVLPNSPALPNDSSRLNPNFGSANPNSQNRDGFAPASPGRGSFGIFRSNDARTNPANTTGNYANSNSPYSNPTNYPNGTNPPFLNSNTTYPNNNSSVYPTIATNPNPPAFGAPATNPNWQNTPGYSGSPALSQLNNAAYGQPTSPYANSNASPYLSGQYPNLAARLGASQVPPSGGRYDDLPYDDPTVSNKENKLLPFLLLFSIVGNVYLGLWMSHLRTRYRQLLGNMRGVPLADLDN